MREPKPRPSANDRILIAISALKWADEERETYPGLIPAEADRRTMFAQKLSEAAVPGLRIGAEETAAKLAASMAIHVDADLVDAMESFGDFHRGVHKATVSKWLELSGPEQPFEDYARIEAKAHAGPEFGIGVMSDRYKASGELLFLPDGMRGAATEKSGYIRSWQILRWEDVIRQLPVTAGDVEAMAYHRQAEREIESRFARRRQVRGLQDMVAGHAGMDREAACSIYRKIAGTPEEAARIIAALRIGAEAELAERSGAAPETPGFAP